MTTSSRLVPLAWCVLGYFFLDRGEAAHSIVASMAAITAACWSPEPRQSAGAWPPCPTTRDPLIEGRPLYS
jgi:hypothetical protein